MKTLNLNKLFIIILLSLFANFATYAKAETITEIENKTSMLPNCDDNIVTEKVRAIIDAEYTKSIETRPIHKRKQKIITQNLTSLKESSLKSFDINLVGNLKYQTEDYSYRFKDKISETKFCFSRLSNITTIFLVMIEDASQKGNWGGLLSGFIVENPLKIHKFNLDFINANEQQSK